MRIALLIAIAVTGAILIYAAPHVPLGAHYHDFADKRTLLRIPNALDVLSNIPFFVVGLWGCVWTLHASSPESCTDHKERIPYAIFFAGVALTGIGSLWYHVAPSNARLPWDLLPMTCSFMSMVVAIIMERIGIKAGILLLAPLLILGAASVALWYFTEIAGHGEYRFYLGVQFFPPILLALIIALFPPRYTGTRYLVIAFGFFVMAKVFETFDRAIFRSIGFASGHSLKHVTAAVACFWVLLMLQSRRALTHRPNAASRMHPVLQEFS